MFLLLPRAQQDSVSRLPKDYRIYKNLCFHIFIGGKNKEKKGEKRNRAVSVGLQKRCRNVLAPRFHEAWKSAQYHRDQPEFSVIYILSLLDETVLTGNTLKSRRQFKVERNFSFHLEPIPRVFCKICPLMSLGNENKLVTPQAELPTDSPEFSVALTVDIQLSVLNLGLKAVECIPPGLKSLSA